MAHFAKINSENVVIDVIRVSNNVILNSDGEESEEMGATFCAGIFGEGDYKQCSFNTRRGEHPEGKPLRANYCGVGWIYDPDLDIFYPPAPYPSWTLDEVKGVWNPPVPRPEVETDEEGHPANWWEWNEGSGAWDEVNLTNDDSGGE